MVDASEPALVVGSTQSSAVVDTARADAAGVPVVRRRSGGGAVLVVPGDLFWIDVFVPAGDRLWVADVGRAAHWLGRAWVGALATLGIAATSHEGALLATPWSRLVCFAGLGPGEVRTAGAKVVGVSSRRTRAGALFQCAALLRWDAGALLRLLAMDEADRRRGERELADVAVGVAVTPGELEAAFLAQLPLW